MAAKVVTCRVVICSAEYVLRGGIKEFWRKLGK